MVAPEYSRSSAEKDGSVCKRYEFNPPWKLDEDLRAVGDYLAPLFAREGDGFLRLDWLRQEEKR